MSEGFWECLIELYSLAKALKVLPSNEGLRTGWGVTKHLPEIVLQVGWDRVWRALSL